MYYVIQGQDSHSRRRDIHTWPGGEQEQVLQGWTRIEDFQDSKYASAGLYAKV